MRKFNNVYKEKQTKAIELIENKILNDFKNVYGVLLEKYKISDFYTLNEEEQNTFLSELNSFWIEEEGITEKGKKFLSIRSDVLSENSTSLQKKNYLKYKADLIISETFRQSELKWKIYDIVNEIYNETKAKSITDILSPNIITEIIEESLKKSVGSIINEINIELNESSKEVNLLNEKKDPKAEIRNRGDVVFSAESKSVKDDKDHFPINNKAQARNALARCHQYSSSPSWYLGSLDSLIKRVTSAVHKKYPGIKISK